MHEQEGWQEVGPGVFRRRYERYDLNVGLVVGDGGALLVDTRCTEREGAELRREAEAVAGVPIRAVVNTHAHFDHCFGNAAFGGAAVWGQRACAAGLLASGEAQRRLVLAELDGDAADDLAATRIVPPTELVDVERTCSAGDRLVRLAFLGRGHTDHDLVVSVPGAGVVFAGDLVEESGPPAFEDAWPLEWPATLDRLVGLIDGCVVVPGHGDVVDLAFVRRQRAELAAVAELARRVRDGELDLAGAIRASPLPEAAIRTAVARVSGRSRRSAGSP
jgi:glyoxylase-like metal-dependent hydrolase (beta-lactamase superfamily II)